MNNVVEIKFIGYDNFNRGSYITKNGSHVVKVDNDFYSRATNDINGEPYKKLITNKLKVVQEFTNES